MAQTLRSVAGGTLLLLAMAVPWLLGGVPTGALWIAFYVACAALSLWLLSYLIDRSVPSIPAVCLVCAVVLAAQGAWMTVNARTHHDPATGKTLPRATIAREAPGAVEDTVAAQATAHAVVMLAIAVVACDLARYRWFRRASWIALALLGASLVLFHILVQNGLVVLPEGLLSPYQGRAFATYNYHGSAGAMLNFCLPIALGWVVLAARRGPRWPVILYVGLTLVVLAGVAINVSRAAQFLAVVLVVATPLLALRLQRRFQESVAGTKVKPIALLLVLFAGVALALGVVHSNRDRWFKLAGQLQDKNPRVLVWRIGLSMLPGGGLFGHGPGAYKMLYPSGPPDLLKDLYPRWIVEPHRPGGPVGIWSHAHQDYLQTIVEWGWVGAAAWFTLWFGSLYAGVRALRGDRLARSDRVLLGCTLLALTGVFLHALVDFPLQILSISIWVGLALGMAWGAGRWEMARDS